MKDYDVYIFDFDGTLVDSEASLLSVFQAGFEAIGRSTNAEEVSKYIHVSLLQCMEMNHIEGADAQIFMDKIIEALDYPQSIAMISFFPDVKETIEGLLSKGKKIGIGSNNVVGHMRLVLEGLKGLHYFQTLVGSDRVEHTKPAPDIMELACLDLGVPCNEKAVYVGDSLQDVETGLAAKADGILVDRENTHPDFEGIKISSLKELLC